MAASSWTAENRASGGSGQKQRQRRIRQSRQQVCQPRPQNLCRPRQRRRVMSRRRQPLILPINRGDRVLRVSECSMAPLPAKKARARRRNDFPAVTNACAAASVRSSRRPRGFHLALAAPLPARVSTHAVSRIACRFPPPMPNRSIFITSVIWRIANHAR